MARTMDRVTALKVARAIRKPGMYADGGGLYLQDEQRRRVVDLSLHAQGRGV
jgi:hypothetical protein